MKTKKHILIAAALVSAPFLVASCGEKKADTNTGNVDTESAAAKPYPPDVCIVSGEELG